MNVRPNGMPVDPDTFDPRTTRTVYDGYPIDVAKVFEIWDAESDGSETDAVAREQLQYIRVYRLDDVIVRQKRAELREARLLAGVGKPIPKKVWTEAKIAEEARKNRWDDRVFLLRRYYPALSSADGLEGTYCRIPHERAVQWLKINGYQAEVGWVEEDIATVSKELRRGS